MSITAFTKSFPDLKSFLTAGLLLACGAACQGPEAQRYALTVYRVPAPAEAGGKQYTLLAFDGRSVQVMAVPLFCASQILDIRSGDTATGISLNVTLDAHSQLTWMQECATHAGGTMAVALDGFIHSSATIPARPTPNGQVCLPGPWTRTEADAIVANAGRNYELVNKRQPKR